jgi:hypothetical protein
MIKSHLALIEFEFNGRTPIRFNRTTNRVQLEIDWNEEEIIGRYLIFNVDCILDPKQYPKIYGDMWLQEYATALLKKQWAWNIMKFSSPLLGGPTLNASEMMASAERDIEKLEERLRKEMRLPPFFEVG